MKAVVLLSGGLDSATAAIIAKNAGYKLYTISFDYGQRHRIELEYAARLAQFLDVTEHKTMRISLNELGGSALTDKDISVPKAGSAAEIGQHIPVTYVPARNLIFLSLAAAYAETRAISDIFIGVNILDYSGYPDCRPEFIESFSKTVNLGTKQGVEGASLQIHTPLIHMNKSEIIHKGQQLGLDFSLTWSCYDPQDNKPCGSCDSCLLRTKGFDS